MRRKGGRSVFFSLEKLVLSILFRNFVAPPLLIWGIKNRFTIKYVIRLTSKKEKEI